MRYTSSINCTLAAPNTKTVLKVSGALRVSVKMLLMLQSEIQVDGGGNTVVTTSVLEVRNLAVLKVIIKSLPDISILV